MSKPYKIHSQEEGRGKIFTAYFDTLQEASRYIQERWQGADYMDGNEAFHTDYSTYELEGFTLKDIGKVSWEGEAPYLYREYSFNDPIPKETTREQIISECARLRTITLMYDANNSTSVESEIQNLLKTHKPFNEMPDEILALELKYAQEAAGEIGES
jgi:hypothetical protein